MSYDDYDAAPRRNRRETRLTDPSPAGVAIDPRIHRPLSVHRPRRGERRLYYGRGGFPKGIEAAR
jgi:hypothetical protein